MDTNATTPTGAQPIQRRPRIKDSLAIGTVSVIESGCKALNSVAAITNGVATRITLYNAGVYLDMVEDANGDQNKVVNAINKCLEIGKAV